MHSADVQHDETATHAPSTAQTFFPMVVRFVSQPSLSGGAALQSCQAEAHPA
jgi:hypothetical protein